MTRGWPTCLTLVLVAGCGRRYDIPSSAMIPTLLIGDRVHVRALEDGEPRRGDIVVFEHRASDGASSPLFDGEAGPDPLDGEDFIKRVIGLPGDRVRLEGDTIYLNGAALATTRLGPTECGVFGRDDEARPVRVCACEPQRESMEGRSWLTQHFLDGDCMPFRSSAWPARFATTRSYLGAEARNPLWPDVEVPAGHVFVLGDNRDASQDSRFTGFVPLARIRGKAVSVVSNRNDPERSDIALD